MTLILSWELSKLLFNTTSIFELLFFSIWHFFIIVLVGVVIILILLFVIWAVFHQLRKHKKKKPELSPFEPLSQENADITLIHQRQLDENSQQSWSQSESKR